MRYTDEMYQKNAGGISYGRILSYDNVRGYGFIRTEEGADIFLSSYNIGKKDSKKLSVGSLVSFIPEVYKDRYSATNVSILQLFPSGTEINLPDGGTIQIKHLKSFGMQKDKKGKPYIYFSSSRGELKRIYPEDIKENGKFKNGDITGFWNTVRRQLLEV